MLWSSRAFYFHALRTSQLGYLRNHFFVCIFKCPLSHRRHTEHHVAWLLLPLVGCHRCRCCGCSRPVTTGASLRGKNFGMLHHFLKSGRESVLFPKLMPLQISSREQKVVSGHRGRKASGCYCSVRSRAPERRTLSCLGRVSERAV